MKYSKKTYIIGNVFRAISLLIFMVPLCSYSQEVPVKSSETIISFDYFQGLSSKDKEERSKAVERFERLTVSEKTSILKNVYIDNERLLDSYSNVGNLLHSLRSIGSIKVSALELDVYRKLDQMHSAIEKNSQTRYEVSGFSGRLKFYTRILPYVSHDGDRSFKVLFKHMKLHWGVSSEVNNALNTMLLIPYSEHSNNIVKLTEVLSYDITDKGHIQYVAALQFITKTFNRLINKKYKNTVNDILAENIKSLKEIDRENIHLSSQYPIKERIREYERLIATFNDKYKNDGGGGVTIVAEYNDFDKVFSALSVERVVPVFHANIPNSGDDYKSYVSGLSDGLFSKSFEGGEVKFKMGLAYRASGYPGDGAILYFLIENNSEQDFIVVANVRFMNAQGHTVNEVDLTNEYVISGVNNFVIGTMLRGPNRQAKNLKVTFTLIDHSNLQPEVSLFKRVFMGAKEFVGGEHVFDQKIFRTESADFPDNFTSLLDRNKINLVFDSSSKRACNDKYNINFKKFSSATDEDEYLLYSAFCSAWGGECSYGHEKQVLYKISQKDSRKEISKVLEFSNKGDNYSRIDEMYDINNDGIVEVSVKENYCLSSRLTIKKLVGNRLIHLVSGTKYSEGGYQAEPMYRANPFVNSEM